MQKETNISKHLSIHSLFKSISSTFISLFVPLIILNEVGYKMALLYFIILSVTIVLSIIAFYKLIIKKPIWAICIHIVFSIASFAIIGIFEINTLTIILNAVFTGVGQALYHSPIFSIISSNKSDTVFSVFQIFSFVGSIIMILFNAYVISLNETFSIWLACLVSFVLFVVSLIPFFMVKGKIVLKSPEEKPFKEVLSKTKHFNVFHVVFGLQDVIVGLIIPLYLAINNLSLNTIAYVVAIINFVKILNTILANYLYKKDKSFWAIIIGCVIFGVCCILMPNLTDKIPIYIVSVIISMSFPLFFITDCNTYSIKTKEFSYQAMILREILVHFFRPIMILPFLFTSNLSILIYLGALMAVVLAISGYFMLKKPKENQ